MLAVMMICQWQGWTADDYEVGIRGMMADVGARLNSPGYDVQADNRPDAANIQTQRNAASKRKPKEVDHGHIAKKENIVKKEKKREEEGNRGRRGSMAITA